MGFHQLVKLICSMFVCIAAIVSQAQSTEPFKQTSPADAAELEARIRLALDKVKTDTAFTLLITANNGHSFQHSVGKSSASTVYRSASTSKLVTATVILWLVDTGVLRLDDHPQRYISDWPAQGNLSQIQLRHLLSFTSGLTDEPNCINNPLRQMASCVDAIARNNRRATAPGSTFHYNSAHLQVAGLMAINALGVDDWQSVFTGFKQATGLFTDAAYDLPSTKNPRLAGGMHWTANEYLEFLAALYHRQILKPETFSLMTQDQFNGTTIASSPAAKIKEEWHYGFGNWIECHNAKFNCTDTTKISSPGAYGAYPFIDFQFEYYGILAREGKLGSFDEGYAVFVSVQDLLQQWAAINR